MDASKSENDPIQAMRPGYTVRLEAFEGPLDLLLHLIRQEEVDIWDIPIAHLTEEYLEYLQMFRQLNINLAADFIVMAATLIYIKSRMLLPPDPNEVESQSEEDPRHELVYQLLEHQKFKNAAQLLYTKETVENSVWEHPPLEIQEGEDDATTVTLFDLLNAFRQVVRRLESGPIMEVARETFTVEDKIAELRQLLLIHETVRFSTFLAKGLTRGHIAVIFLAVLELVRRHEIRFVQNKLFGEILIRRAKVRSMKIDPREAVPDEEIHS